MKIMNIIKTKTFKILLASNLLLLILACASEPKQFVVRSLPLVTRLNRIAVFPLENLSEIPEAASRVTNILSSELYNAQIVNIVEPGEVQQFILRSRIRQATQLDVNTIREASRQLNADGIIFGSLNEYEMISTDLGTMPAVSITLRLVDANSGEIVWAATHSLEGSFKEKAFGIGRVNSLANLSTFVVKDLTKALEVAMYPDAAPVSVEKLPKRVVKSELIPEKPIEEPVIPIAPTKAEMENREAEKERSHSTVMKEWESIKKLSEGDEKEKKKDQEADQNQEQE